MTVVVLRCRAHPRCPWKVEVEEETASARAAVHAAELERITHEGEHEPKPVPYGDPGASSWWHYDPPLNRPGRRE